MPWNMNVLLRNMDPKDDSPASELNIPEPRKSQPPPYEGFPRPPPKPCAKDQEKALTDGVRKLEQMLRDALFARTTAQFNEWRVLRKAFQAFDRDASGSVDIHEFIDALESLGLHSVDSGLPGLGGVPRSVVEELFSRFDADGSGSIEYDEFVNKIAMEPNANPF